jgi:hypothetical protein
MSIDERRTAGEATIRETLAMHERAINRGDMARAPFLSRDDILAIAAYLRSIPGSDFDFESICYDPRLTGLLAAFLQLGYLRCLDDIQTERISA